MFSFEMKDSDPRWAGLSAVLEEWGVQTWVETSFTEAELRSASWLRLVPIRHIGIPEPESGEPDYRAVTYSRDGCEACGVGYRQTEPFRVKVPLKWGRFNVGQLYWVDEFFVLPRFWSSAFAKLRAFSRPVCHVNGDETKEVVQLSVEHVACVDSSRLVGSRCEVCGSTKYAGNFAGMFPSIDAGVAASDADFLRSDIWFGDGAEAARPIFCSQRAFRVLREHQVRGVKFRPVEKL